MPGQSLSLRDSAPFCPSESGHLAVEKRWATCTGAVLGNKEGLLWHIISFQLPWVLSTRGVNRMNN